MKIDETTQMVLDFHLAFGLEDHTASTPRPPDPKVCLTRIQCLTEEVAELAHAMGKGDLVEVLDALTDIQYFLDGTYIACGMHKVKLDAMREVHRTNMAKLDKDGRPIRDKSGRVVKPKGWSPPDLALVLEDHLHALEMEWRDSNE